MCPSIVPYISWTIQFLDIYFEQIFKDKNLSYFTQLKRYMNLEKNKQTKKTNPKPLWLPVQFKKLFLWFKITFTLYEMKLSNEKYGKREGEE